jgi:pseudaminic acid synthase
MKKNFKIGKIRVGPGEKCFIVAELSGNHAGSLQRAKKLIFKAKQAGADAVKLQTYTSDTITLNSDSKDFKIKSDSPWKRKKNLWNLYQEAQTPWAWHKQLFTYAKKINIEIFSSPFDETAVDLLKALNCPAYKIASAEINHIPLLEKVAKTKKPVILSIGLATKQDIALAIKTLRDNGCNKIIVLQCVSEYPAKIKDQNLSLIPKIEKNFNVISGLSDHTVGFISALSSVVIGGSVVEKHFNLNDKIKTVDSFFSIEESNFSKMVKLIREAENSIGKDLFKYHQSKIKNINSRRSIYISKNIEKGEKLTLKNIKVVRPGYSLHPKYFRQLLGKNALKNLKKGARISLKNIK